MTITYTWSVPQTDYTIDPTTGNIDRITAIHWRCTATEGEATSTSYGVVSVPEDDLAATPANMADEAAAIVAAQRLLGADVETNLVTQLDTQAAPTQGSGRIWEIPASTPVWRAGVSYAVDDVALWQGTPYTCLQAHDSQRGWFPPAVPALWNIQSESTDPGGGPTEWIVGEAVVIGDQRTYQGTTYEVIQSHTTQAGWEPPNVPALWAPV